MDLSGELSYDECLLISFVLKRHEPLGIRLGQQ